MSDEPLFARGLVGAAAAAIALLALPAPLGAELLRCKGPDGGVIYTDNKALCPDTEPYQPRGELQREESAAGSDESEAPASPNDALAERLRRAEQRQAAFEAQEAEAERWRKKKEKLQADIEALREKREYLERFITNCNRGGLTYTRDGAGIKRNVECDDIKAEYASLESEEEAAQAALDALPEQCRRAGCLPGWLR